MRKQFEELLQQYQRIAVFSASLELGEIAELISINSDQRPVICNAEQKKMLEEKYKVENILCNQNHLLIDNIQENGCLAFINDDAWSQKLVEHFEDMQIVCTDNVELPSFLTGYKVIKIGV